MSEFTIQRLLAPQHKYTFRARATDFATNGSGWALGPTINIKCLQESSSRIRYSGSWTKVKNSSYWGGTAKKSSKAGASATLTFTGRAFAWVARTGQDRGQALVYVDGVLAATVDLFSSTRQNKRVVFAKSWTSSLTHTVRIHIVGTSGRPTVEVDALLTGE